MFTINYDLQFKSFTANTRITCWELRHFILQLPLPPPPPPQLHKWVLAKSMLGHNPAIDLHSIQGGVKTLLVTFCYGNQRSAPAYTN